MESEEEEKVDDLQLIQLASNIKSLIQLEDEITQKTKKKQWKESYKLVYNYGVETIELNSLETFARLLEITKNEDVVNIELSLKFKVCLLCVFFCLLFVESFDLFAMPVFCMFAK